MAPVATSYAAAALLAIALAISVWMDLRERRIQDRVLEACGRSSTKAFIAKVWDRTDR